MIRFTSKFPFIKVKRLLTGEDYCEPITMGGVVMSADNQLLIKNSRNVLSENQINLNKIKFVFEKSFIYDVDNNIINPEYKIITPKKAKHPTIEVGKPANTLTVYLGENRTYNNFSMLKQLVKQSKKGVVLMVGTDFEEVMWLTNLDDAIDYYNQIQENLNYNT